MIKRIHPVAGGIALLTVAAFWLSTAISELVGTETHIVAVKTAIPWGFLVLIPALAAAGGSGMKLAGGSRAGVIGSKAKRMPFIALNGILVLVPCAFFLAHKAQLGQLDTSFYAVQAVELLAGAVNLTLLGLNMRDGLKLRSKSRGSAKP